MRIDGVFGATAALCAGLIALSSGCLMPRYLSQAAAGQLDLLTRARSIEDVIADPEVPERTRVLLSAIPDIKAFGARRGLDTARNYRTYTELDREAAVWFVGAAAPLSFEPRRWCFPVAGCFTGLGWFDEQDALAHRASLERRGWDAMARPAIAYSTGGWFPDPVLSSMLSDEDDAWGELANVILHESVHATVLVPDQMFFNEGIATFVADEMADDWLVETFGPDSPERASYRTDQDERAARVERMMAAYRELEGVYRSKDSDAAKLARKKAILDRTVADLRLRYRPNNATLVEVRLYHASRTGFAGVRAACGSLRAMLGAADRLTRSDFGPELQEDLEPVMRRLTTLCRGAATGAPAHRAPAEARKTGAAAPASSP